MKKGKQHKLPGTFAGKPAKAVAAHRGTPLWAVNRLRSDALVCLLDDLVDLEATGLPEQRCQLVQNALGKIANAASAIPDDHWWHRQIHSELQDFLDLYIQWNDVKGVELHHRVARSKKLSALRDKRCRIATRIRNNQFILENELDLALIRQNYDALGELVQAIPDVFRSLRVAVARFNDVTSVA